jgi:hypothetical protein
MGNVHNQKMTLKSCNYMQSKEDELSGGCIVAAIKTLACNKQITFWGGQTICPFWIGMLQ